MELEKLIQIGFSEIGQWNHKNGNLILLNSDNINYQNALYAFVCENKILYVGKTTNTLKTRFNGYLKPGPSQNTNKGINECLLEKLRNGDTILIYAFEDKGFLKYGDFEINLAEGLEKSIIDKINPKWNGKGCKNKQTEKGDGENVYWGKEDWEWDSFFSCHEKIRNGEPIIRTMKEYNIYPVRFIELQQKLPPNLHISNELLDNAIFESFSTEELEVLCETIKSQNIKGETEKFGKRVEKELKRRNTIA